MSDITYDSKNEEGGAMKSYVTGFILSLVFTFIPYYLVDKQTISGTKLLVTILGFAMLQMLVQVTFFLHLGRGPKPRWNLFFFIATVGIILVVVGGSILIIKNLHYNMSPVDQTKRLADDEGIYQVGGQQTGACQQIGLNHQVVIKNGQVSPSRTDAHKCDTMTFVNEDSDTREIAFGQHPEHGIYAGLTEVPFHGKITKTITLSEIGSYKFHDHLHEEIAGDFRVTE